MTSVPEKNAHYAAMNDRFDGRAIRLRKMGFSYQRIEEWDTAIFWRKDPCRPNRKQTISAAFVMCADETVWADRVADLGGK